MELNMDALMERRQYGQLELHLQVKAPLHSCKLEDEYTISLQSVQVQSYTRTHHIVTSAQRHEHAIGDKQAIWQHKIRQL